MDEAYLVQSDQVKAALKAEFLLPMSPLLTAKAGIAEFRRKLGRLDPNDQAAYQGHYLTEALLSTLSADESDAVLSKLRHDNPSNAARELTDALAIVIAAQVQYVRDHRTTPCANPFAAAALLDTSPELTTATAAAARMYTQAEVDALLRQHAGPTSAKQYCALHGGCAHTSVDCRKLRETYSGGATPTVGNTKDGFFAIFSPKTKPGDRIKTFTAAPLRRELRPREDRK